MIIILEGPDGSGKTHLANQLRQQNGYHIIHRSQPKDDAEKLAMLDEYIKSVKSGNNFIFDRCWYSELVYGPVMRDSSVISLSSMYNLERMLADKGAIIIHCTAPLDVLWRRCMLRGEDYILSKEQLGLIVDGFNTLFNDFEHLVPVVRYEYKEM